MSLTASQILKTHGQRTKQKNKTKPNFTTIGLHKGMHSSSFYGTILKSHMLQTQGQNHVLSSASRQYENQTNKKFRTRSLSKKDTNTQNPEMVRSQVYGSKGQHEEAFHTIFKNKAERVPEIEDLLREELKQKAYLQKRIKQLKLMTKDDDKKKIKISLNCNKMSNQIERLQANTNKVAEENFNLNIQIKKTTQNRNQFQEEVNALHKRNKWTEKRIKEQYKMVQDLKQHNIATQVKLREETKKFNYYKETETKCIKNMSNNYMYQNQLKEEKALLLASIQTNFNKNR